MLAGLILLLDLGARSVLGLSGLMLALAGGGGGGGAGRVGGLGPYQGVAQDRLFDAIVHAVLEALPGLLLIAASVVKRADRAAWGGRLALAVIALADANSVLEASAALPALLGSLAMPVRAARTARPGSDQIM